MKNALVTGSSSGLGRSVALKLSKEGYDILVHGRRKQGIDETCQLIEQSGGRSQGRLANLREITAAQELARWAVSSGELQVVIHNAGGYPPAPAGEESLAAWDEILNVQLRAVMHITAITLPSLIESQGAYVFIGSIDSLVGNARRSASTAASAGRIGFAKSLFEEVREHGVRVITIHPGFMNTSLVSPGRVDPAKMIQTEDIATLIVTAVSLPQSSCVVEMTVRPQHSPYS